MCISWTACCVLVHVHKVFHASISITYFNILDTFQCHVATETSTRLQGLMWRYSNPVPPNVPSGIYVQAAATSTVMAVAYTTFTQIWCQLLPYIVVRKPMSDLCWVCQQSSAVITCSANRHSSKYNHTLTYMYMLQYTIHTYECRQCLHMKVGLIEYIVIHYTYKPSEKPSFTFRISQQRSVY